MVLPLGRLGHKGLSMRKGTRCHLVGSLMQKGQEKMLYADYELGEVLPETYENIEPAGSKQRRAGVVLHPTSLPGEYGIGDLGAAAYRFVDFLVSAKQSLWQVKSDLHSYEAPILVNCAGAWGARIASWIGDTAPVTPTPRPSNLPFGS